MATTPTDEIQKSGDAMIGVNGGEYGDRIGICLNPTAIDRDLWRRQGFEIHFYDPDRARQVFKELTGKDLLRVARG